MAIRICSIRIAHPLFAPWSRQDYCYGSTIVGGPASRSSRRTGWFSGRRAFPGHHSGKFGGSARIFGCFRTYRGTDSAFLNLFCELAYDSIRIK